MKGSKLMLLLFLVISLEGSRLLQTDSISLNTQTLGIEKETDFWKIRLLCTSRIGSCFFQFKLLPENWETQGQKILVPIEDTTKTRAFLLQVDISEPTGQTVEKQIVLFFSDQEIEITARNRPTITDSTQNEQNPSEEEREVPSEFIPKNRQDLSWLQENAIIPFIPSITLLDEVIEEGDIVQIVRLIQNVVADKSDCEVKVDYLRRLNKRFKEYISENQALLSEEKSILASATIDLESLNREKERLQSDINSMNNDERNDLEARQKQLSEERSESFSKFSTFTIVANRYKNLFQLSVSSAGVNPDQLDDLEQQVQKDEEQIQDINSQIEDLMEQKELLQGKVARNKKKIKDTIAVGSITPERIRNLQQNFKRFNADATQYKFRYEEAERQLNEVREVLSKIKTKEDGLQQELEEVQKQIRQVEKVQDSRDSIKLQQLVSTLKRNLPNIESAYEKCSEAPEPNKNENVVIAILDPPQVPIPQVQVPPRSSFSNLPLQKINIFSTEWVIRFGVPTASNFNCAVKEDPGSGYGVIVDIKNAMMSVRDANQRLVGLYLGICSSIMAETADYVPEVGDLIEWQGDMLSSVVANVHQANIFRNPQNN